MAFQSLRKSVELEQLQKLTAAGAILSFAVMIISIVGEVLPWWNTFGEVGAALGGFLGVMLSIATFFLSATGKQARRIATGVDEGNRKHDVTNAKLDHIDAKLERHTELLTDIRDALRRP